jgi:hypothetical protein
MCRQLYPFIHICPINNLEIVQCKIDKLEYDDNYDNNYQSKPILSILILCLMVGGVGVGMHDGSLGILLQSTPVGA